MNRLGGFQFFFARYFGGSCALRSCFACIARVNFTREQQSMRGRIVPYRDDYMEGKLCGHFSSFISKTSL
jgi:hypothetical protein